MVALAISNQEEEEVAVVATILLLHQTIHPLPPPPLRLRLSMQQLVAPGSKLLDLASVMLIKRLMNVLATLV
jgi:hypothetical protein